MKPAICCIALISVLFLQCDSDDDDQTNRPRLSSVTMYMQNQSGAFRPGYVRTYLYSSNGKLENEWYASYDTQTEQFDSLWSVSYAYQNNRVVETKTKFTDSSQEHSVQYTYHHDGRLLSMNVHESVQTTATVTYDEGDTVRVFYQHSNGRSFTYRFVTVNGNITYDQTLNDAGKLSGESTYEFDDHINPYSLLGYTDVFFTNQSQNNKTKTSSQYYSDAFPTSVPASYEYTYNEAGLPIKQIIQYKSYPNGVPSGAIQYVFEYE